MKTVERKTKGLKEQKQYCRIKEQKVMDERTVPLLIEISDLPGSWDRNGG